MKRNEQIANLRKLTPADIRKEIADLEKKLQAARLSVAFGKSKQVSELRNLRKQLARTLTIGNQKVREHHNV